MQNCRELVTTSDVMTPNPVACQPADDPNATFEVVAKEIV
jgi:hypothetical protein